jgi:hypothetical protein
LEFISFEFWKIELIGCLNTNEIVKTFALDIFAKERMNYFEIFDRWYFNFSSSELYKSMDSSLPSSNSTENPDSLLILRILKFLANLEEPHDVIQHDDQI